MNQHSQTLAAQFLPVGQAGAFARAAMLVLLGTGLLTVAAKVQVPFYPVPMTLQTFAVTLIGAAYGWRLAVLTVLAYIAEGLLGLPVFTNTPPLPAGPGYLLGPTGGFLVGFVASAFASGFAVDHGLARRPLSLFAAMLLGQAMLFALGFIWLSQLAWLPNGATGIGFAGAWNAAMAPFLIGDLVKTGLAALLASGLYAAARPS